MFENITENFQINSTYIVIGLVIVALVCIYLLYTTLSSSTYYNDLKANINELIVQNKKRDEIIHFLVNQIQMQQSEAPIKEVGGTEAFENHLNQQELHVEEHLPTDINDDDIKKLDKLLENDFPTSTEQKTQQQNNTELDNLLNDDDLQELHNITNVNTNIQEEQQEEEHDEAYVEDDENQTQDEEDNESETEESSDEIIANILNGGIKSNELPKDKARLSIFTVADLREHAKNLNISSAGNKSALINRIYEVL